jgi:hypothetical protein
MVTRLAWMVQRLVIPKLISIPLDKIYLRQILTIDVHGITILTKHPIMLGKDERPSTHSIPD